MWTSESLPWIRIDDFLLNVERIVEPRKFCDQVIKNIFSLIPYDQARAYLVNPNGKVDDIVLLSVEQSWSDAYLEYYSKIENGRYSLITRDEDQRHYIPGIEGAIVDWTSRKVDEFLKDYIRPQGLNYSIGFRLSDTHNLTHIIVCLDRISRNGYSSRETEIIRKVVPHLENYYKNISYYASACAIPRSSSVEKILTKREMEIAELIRKGVTPANIGKYFDITLATVYRHIANIHRKLDVSTRQELVIKLMGYPGEV